MHCAAFCTNSILKGRPKDREVGLTLSRSIRTDCGERLLFQKLSFHTKTGSAAHMCPSPFCRFSTPAEYEFAVRSILMVKGLRTSQKDVPFFAVMFCHIAHGPVYRNTVGTNKSSVSLPDMSAFPTWHQEAPIVCAS